MTKFEAFARAIAGQPEGDLDERWYRKARAGLEAIKHADSAMCAGINDLFGPVWDKSTVPPRLVPRFAVTCADTWSAMIDNLLVEALCHPNERETLESVAQQIEDALGQWVKVVLSAAAGSVFGPESEPTPPHLRFVLPDGAVGARVFGAGDPPEGTFYPAHHPNLDTPVKS